MLSRLEKREGKKIEKLRFFQRGYMVWVKNVKYGYVFIFRKISQKNVFDNILETKHAFKTRKTRREKNRKIEIFPKGLVHGFGQKCKMWPCFYFSQNKPKKNVFENILETKKAFQEYKNEQLKKLKNWDLVKEVNVFPFFLF